MDVVLSEYLNKSHKVTNFIFMTSSLRFSIRYQNFLLQPNVDKTFEFEQSLEVRTDAKSESGLVEGFPSMNISPGRDPDTIFTSFLVSRLVSGYYPVLTDSCILLR